MVANTELQRVGLSGWRTGLGNLLGKENRAWWASRQWLVQGIVWAVIINGVVALVLAAMPQQARLMGKPAPTGLEMLSQGIQILFQIGPAAMGLGAIILVQDAILGERQLGITEWLLSRPVSRSAYMLSKLLAHALGVLVILVVLQGALGYGLLWRVTGELVPLPHYLVGMAGLAVNTLFYLTLTLMMGVLTTSRRALLGGTLGMLLGGSMVPQFLAPILGKYVLLTPWSLLNVLPAPVLGMPLPLSIWLPIGLTAALSVIFVAVTLVRFERLEF
jgi:ABC-2 type transport system permease protein